MKKKSKGRQWLAWMLSGAMAVTLMPTMAFAAGSEAAGTYAGSANTKDVAGDYYVDGEYTITLEVAVDSEGKISSLTDKTTVSSSANTDFYNNAYSAMSKWLVGKTKDEVQNVNVKPDVVSGATLSAKAIQNAVMDAFSKVPEEAPVNAPLSIQTVADLEDFAKAVDSGETYEGKTVTLEADLDLSSIANWNPIGAESGTTDIFNGTFDGQDKTISGMKFSGTFGEETNVGLFSTLGDKAVVKNLKMTGTSVNLGVTAGSAPRLRAGSVAGDTKAGSPVVDSVTVDGSVSVTTETSMGMAGGILGRMSRGAALANSVADVTVTASYTGSWGNAYAGGLTAMTGNGCSLVNSVAVGNLSGITFEGGAAGMMTGSINNVYTDVVLSGKGENSGAIAGQTMANGNYVYYTGTAEPFGTVTMGEITTSPISSTGKSLASTLNQNLGAITSSVALESWGVGDKGYAIPGVELTEGSSYVLMNIPYADFYKAELGENDAAVDAVTSSTLNKPRTGTLAGGSYHKNADGSDISGVIYPVFVKDTAQLEGLTEITDASSVTISVTNRGTTTETTYVGKDALFESADYSYYKLTEKPARYKTMDVSDGVKTFSAVSGGATTVNDASGEVNEAGHHADVEIKLSDTTGIEQGQAVSGAVVTFEDGSKVGLRHVSELWRATEIGGTAEQFADKTITNVRYYTQDSVIDFPMEIVVKKKAAAATAEFTDANTLQVTGLPADLENAKATVQTKVGRGETPTVIAENVDINNGVIATTDAAEDGKTYSVLISSDNYLRISAEALYDIPSAGDDFLSQLIGEYQPLFEGATLNSEYDHYWNDYTAAVVGESTADDTVAYVKGSINAKGYGENNDAPNFFCGFTNDVATITFGGEDGRTVTFTKKDGSSVTHTYEYVKEADATGKYGEYDMAMSGYLYKAKEESADEFQYLLMFPDTPDTTYHLEFRYGGTEEDVLNLLDGPYAYWVGSAIQTSALTEEDEDTLQKVISLFVVENLAGNETAETNDQRTGLVGTWDCDFSAFPEYANAKMYIVLSGDGKGKTYADLTGSGEPGLVSEYTFYAYDPDKADGRNGGTYIALNPDEETVTPGEYEITQINGKKALVFTSNEGVITYYLRNENQGGNNSGGGGGSVTPTYKVTAPAQTGNGSVSASLEKAKKGDTVTITVTPEEGYEPDTVTVKDKDGNAVEIKDNGDGTYSFTMPASAVSVEASFKEKEAEPQPQPPVPDTHENCPSEPFEDVDTSLWYHEGIDYVITNGLMKGIADDAFAPNDTTTRAMIVTILYRLEKEPAAEASSFKDLEAGSWYEAAVNWAAANDIVNGYSAEEFGPADSITREQMAAILCRYAAYKGQDVSGKADLSGFTDSSAVSDWATDAVAWAVNAELINGMTETTLVPQGSATRAQIATLMMRLLK